jgi:hypothetical protein
MVRRGITSAGVNAIAKNRDRSAWNGIALSSEGGTSRSDLPTKKWRRWLLTTSKPLPSIEAR